MPTDHTAYSPTHLAEACELLAERGRNARIIAGGTDLMVLVNAHQLNASEFIDIWRVEELRGIEDEGDTIRIGALTTYTQLIQSPLVRQYAPALVEASRTIGAIQIQNRGTLGGNIANGSPAGDSLPVLAAFGAEVEIASLRGVRRFDFNKFYTGYRKTVMEADEILLAVRVPKLNDTERSFFYKVGTRRAQAISKIVMAIRADMGDGTIQTIRIGLGSVAPTVIRAPQTETLLNQARLEPAIIQQARQTLSREIAPITDLRSTEHYRRTVAGNVLAQFLSQMQSALRLFFLLAICGCLQAHAQIQIGTVNGAVMDQAGARVSGANVRIKNSITGFDETRFTDARGEFAFNNVPFANYVLKVEANGFQSATQQILVRSNLPLNLELSLYAAGANVSTTIAARDNLIETQSSSSESVLTEGFIRQTTGATRSLALQRLTATTPGWTTQNNGLMHIRGVDDGILYVVDGIPTVDRLDAASAGNFDTEMIRSLKVITGNIPAEFGGRSGAIVQIQPKSGIDLPWSGSLSASSGSFKTGELTANLGGSVYRKFGIFAAGSTSRSDRWLDPVDLDNFNNRGGAAKINLRADWHPNASASRDILLFDVAANGADFRVPNREEQEAAGQRQRQELRDNAQAVSWQRLWSANTVTNLAWFRRDYQARLFGSEQDTPIFARQDRRHIRQGALASLTHASGRHTIKAGLEATRVTPREFFTFAITDKEEAKEFEISEAALAFDRDDPFVFRDRRAGTNLSWYAQDQFSPWRNLTLHLGLRYDRSTLPVIDQQFSPRLGAVYSFPSTRTAIRASFNRLYMPPQIENLLLADSAQARQLSPFAGTTGGGASIRPEKMSAYEVGVAQDVRGLFKLDLAWWHRRFRNFDDPNVFFNTSVIFPNSVASGFARGLDVRLDVPQRRGWSGYVSYTNSRILQTGPINGGLFLTEEFLEIGPGTRFIPDHDQRNVGAFGVTYTQRGWWASLSGRHESGVSLEVEEERLQELMKARGAELVNFARRRVRPWTVFDFSTGVDLFEDERVNVSAQFDIQNFTDHQFAYNFGNPFEGTHFGHPRMFSGRLKISFR